VGLRAGLDAVDKRVISCFCRGSSHKVHILSPIHVWDSSVSIESRLRAGQPRDIGSTPGRDKILLSSPQHPKGPPILLANGYRGLFPGGKAAGA
jgi:hypothetical protein